ncbi:MAG: hypothetical protein LBB29_04195, partial [Holosporaceae bacterium]|nr:hypothetical protein [Holosporaceae bacterium]
EIQALLGERLNTPLDNLQIPEELIVRDGNSFQGIELRNDMSPFDMLQAIATSVKVDNFPYEY